MPSSNLKMHTPNLVDSNIERIAELFPNCITEKPKTDEQGNVLKDASGQAILERGIDFELLKQELSHSVIDGSQERYRLDWVGKREAIVTANSPIAKTLRPCRAESVDFDTTGNLFIEGDNLEALKLLQESYLGKVKMIYIDPPYNTGNDFIYNDDFAADTAEFFERSGQVDGDGNRLVANTESNGRFHSDWLSMMYSRLKLARNLLSDDGVIFISIDENEVFNLRNICNEVFGISNFLTELVVKVRHEERILKGDKDFHEVCEFCLIYRKSDKFIQPKKLEDNTSIDKYICTVEITKEPEEITILDGKKVEIYSPDAYKLIKHKNPSDDYFQEINIRGSLKEGNSSGRFYMKHFDRIQENFGYLYKVEGIGSDKYSYRYFIRPKSENYSNGSYLQGVPVDKKDIKEIPYPNFYDFVLEFNNVGYEGNGVEFKNGKKPQDFLNQLFTLAGIQKDKNALVMDFFGGSASTAEACINANLNDNGNRKFIMVQINENLEDTFSRTNGATKVSIQKMIEFLDSIDKPHFLTEIGKERIRRAGAKIRQDNADKDLNHLDTGFRVLKIDTSNMNDIYYRPQDYNQDLLATLENNIKPDRSDEDLLFQFMLDTGVPLSLPIERTELSSKSGGHTIYQVGGNSLIASLDYIDANMVNDIAALNPLKFITSERAIATDSDKTNIKERFKQLSPHTDVRFI